jgi:hypothetical protein
MSQENVELHERFMAAPNDRDLSDALSAETLTQARVDESSVGSRAGGALVRPLSDGGAVMRGLKARCACVVCLAIGLTPLGVADASTGQSPSVKSLERQIVHVEHAISVKDHRLAVLGEALGRKERRLANRLTHEELRCSRLFPLDQRLETACDDAAGLGIAVNLQSDIAEYGQATRDANDGIGGLEELHEQLNRLALELEERR